METTLHDLMTRRSVRSYTDKMPPKEMIEDILKAGMNAPSGKNRQSAIKDIKDYVWNYRIKSLLREYLRGEDEKSIKGFLDEAAKKFFGEATENNKQDA